jgi:arylformamidase
MPTDQTANTYRGMERAAIDAAYNNSAAVTDSADRVEKWRRRGEKTRARPGARLDLRYGPGANNRIDYFPTDTPSAPLFIFIHGGYWFRNTKEIFAFVADGPCANGINVATVGYTLAPEAGLSQIVQEISQAIDYLVSSADGLGFDRAAIIVGGWSAGGHLTALAAGHPDVAGVLPISGIFDLTPIALSYINDALSLTADEVAALSPLFNPPRRQIPHLLFVGGDELPELQRQSTAYAAATAAKGVPTALEIVPGQNHFTIVDELASRDGVLMRGLLRLARQVSARKTV